MPYNNILPVAYLLEVFSEFYGLHSIVFDKTQFSDDFLPFKIFCSFDFLLEI